MKQLFRKNPGVKRVLAIFIVLNELRGLLVSIQFLKLVGYL
jgi:hypothetical protein